MNTNVRILAMAVNAAILAMGTTTVSATNAVPDTTASTPAAGEIEEVVITARKVQESQQTVPISVVAYSAKALQQDVILTAFDLVQHVTGLVVSAAPEGANWTATNTSLCAFRRD